MVNLTVPFVITFSGQSPITDDIYKPDYVNLAAYALIWIIFTVSEIRFGATYFKNFYGLAVHGSPSQIIIRNLLKFMPIWFIFIGHNLMDHEVTSWITMSGGILMLAGLGLGLINLASLFTGPKLATYDRISGASVSHYPNMDRGL